MSAMLWPWLRLALAIGAATLVVAAWFARRPLVARAEKAAGRFAERWLPPRRRWLFDRRVTIRLCWLRLRRWWSGLHPLGLLGHLPRPLIVLATAAAILAALWWAGLPLRGADDRLTDLLNGKTSEKLNWQTALILIGAPIAFVFWWFRDFHVFQTLENQRKDVNLKEFQEIQLRAAGALDEKLPRQARDQLQIAALHQLRAFLRGEYGRAFCRPALELLLAGHAAAMDRIGHRPAIAAWLVDNAGARGRQKGAAIREAIDAASARWRASAVDRERAGIIRDEARAIFRRRPPRAGGDDWPLNGRTFDGIAPHTHTLLARLDLSGASFVGADLSGAHLEGAILSGAHLEGADLSFAHLEDAVLSAAHLEGADLSFAHLEGAYLSDAHLEGAELHYAHLEGAVLRGAHLEGADLFGAHLEGAVLRGAHLEGADLRYAHLEGANLSGAHLTKAQFNARTRLAPHWHTLTEPERQAHRDAWIARGARLAPD